MGLSDVAASRIGLISLIGLLGGPIVGLALMDRASGWGAAAFGFGLPLVSLVVAFAAMTWFVRAPN